jgi:hypothetical protein
MDFVFNCDSLQLTAVLRGDGQMSRRCAIALIAVVAAFAIAAPGAAADTKTLNFSLSGSQNGIPVFNIGGFCDVCWPDGGSGTNFLGATADVHDGHELVVSCEV